MASASDDFVSVLITYQDVKTTNPGWSDSMVEDYLAEKRNLATLTKSVESRLDYLEGTLVVTNVDVTTIGNTTIICTEAITVKLTVGPNDKDIVRVKQTDFEVTVNGNGRNIEGNSEVIMIVTTASLKTDLNFIYSAELDEWFVI